MAGTRGTTPSRTAKADVTGSTRNPICSTGGREATKFMHQLDEERQVAPSRSHSG